MTLLDKERTVKKSVKLTYQHRDKTAPMGRFGGGWQWQVGVQVGGKTAIVNLLVASVRIDWSQGA